MEKDLNQQISSTLKMDVLKYSIVFLLPWILCLIYCGLREITLKTLYLPSASNNDTLFYYKLVEAYASKGGLRGYFGYNESHALIGGFGAWSPVVILPWLVCAMMFGWNYIAPLIFNIIFFSLALSVFAWLMKIEWKNIALLFMALLLFPNLMVHILTVLPEIIILSVLLVFWGLCYSCSYEETDTKIFVMYLLSFYLTLIRPYFGFIMLFPSMKLIRRKRITAYLISVFMPVLAIAAYFLVVHFFCSEYFEPLYDTSIFGQILSGHIKDAAIKLLVDNSKRMTEVKTFIVDGFISGVNEGIHYFITIFLIIVFVILYSLKKHDKGRTIYLFYSLVSLVVMISIIVLMGAVNQGGRHLFSLTALGIILLSCIRLEHSTIVANAVCIVFLIIFISRGSLTPKYYDIPIENIQDRADNDYWAERYAERGVEISNEVGYENTFAWVVYDVSDEGKFIKTNYHELYSIPTGMGISCCKPEYVLENYITMKSKYIAALSGGMIDNLCKERGCEEIGRTNDMVVFRLN